MTKIRESRYQVATGEIAQIRINPMGISHMVAVVHNSTVLQPDANRVYEFQIRRSVGKIEFVVITCTFLPSDPPDSKYEIFVQDRNGQSWADCVIKKTDHPMTWEAGLRFIVA